MIPEGENRNLPAPVSSTSEAGELALEASGIAALLPRYNEAMNDGITYEIIERFDVDGHEVAWLEFTGKVVYDITEQGNEGKEFKGRDLKCQCEFTEDVGWKVEDGRKFNLDTHCYAVDRVIQQRQEQLRDEYTERFRGDENPEPKDHLEEIVFDLIQRRKSGEFLEAGSGAVFYGGYYYLQTLKSVSGAEWEDVHIAIGRLMSEKKIDLEGFVVQEYRVPPPPIWDAYASLEPNLGPRLGHIPIFGPDLDDVDEIQEALQKVLDGAKKSLPSKKAPLEIAPKIEE